MTLLITGGSGFIGSALVRKALDRGEKVVNIDKLTYAGNPANLAEIETDPNYTFVQADIADQKVMVDVFAKHKPRAIFNLAAESHVDRSIDGTDSFIQTNIIGTYSLLQAARSFDRPDNFRFVHVSTDEVFGDLSRDDPAFTEETAYNPSSPYSASKAASDHLVRAWGRTFDLPVMITNCSNNYGPRQYPEKLIPVVILSALHGQPIPVYGDGKNIRDWLHVDDHAEALLTVLDKGKNGQTYAVGGDSERTNIDLVTAICESLDSLHPKNSGSYKDQISFVTDRPGHDRRYAINAAKIKSELGWSPQTQLEQGLRDTVKWYLDHPGWWTPLLEDTPLGQRLGLGK